jgi:hypothetical protein
MLYLRYIFGNRRKTTLPLHCFYLSCVVALQVKFNLFADVGTTESAQDNGDDQTTYSNPKPPHRWRGVLESMRVPNSHTLVTGHGSKKMKRIFLSD